MKHGTTSQNTTSINPKWNKILKIIHDIDHGIASIDTLFIILSSDLLWMRKTKNSGIEDSLIFLLASKYPVIFEQVWKKYHKNFTAADLILPTTGGCLLKVLMKSSDPLLKPIIKHIFEKFTESNYLEESFARDIRYEELGKLYNTSTSQLNDEYEDLILHAIASQSIIENDSLGLWNLIAKAARFSQDQDFYIIWNEIKEPITLEELRKSSKGISIIWLLALLATRDQPQIFNEVWQKYHQQFTANDLITSPNNICVLMLLMHAAQTHLMLKPIIEEILQRFPNKAKNVVEMFELQNTYKQSYTSQDHIHQNENEEMLIATTPVNELQSMEKIVKKLELIIQKKIPADSILEDLNPRTMRMVVANRRNKGVSVWHLLIVTCFLHRRIFETTFKNIWKKYSAEITYNILISNVKIKKDAHATILWLLARMNVEKYEDSTYHVIVDIWKLFGNDITLDNLRFQYNGTSVLSIVALKAMLDEPLILHNIWQKFHNQITDVELFTPIPTMNQNLAVVLMRAANKHPLLNYISSEITDRYQHVSDANAFSSYLRTLNDEQTESLINEITNISASNSIGHTERQNHSVELSFSIHDKYIHGRLPVPPKPVSTSLATLPLHTYKHTFETLNKCPSKDFVPKQIVFGSKSASFTGDLYSCTPLNDKESITFICARRTINALIPQITTKNRSVLVLTAEEFESLKPILPNNLDALVVKSLQSDTHGTYTSLGMITCRRLAIFLCAHYLDVDNFLMLDDNIKNINFSENVAGSSWRYVYTLLSNNLQDYGCLSVKTLSPKTTKEGSLGSKMFMINMKEIKKYFSNANDMFMFFPDAAQASKWGEDYYMQIMMHELLKPNGYKVLEQNTICLERSRKNRNLFFKTGAKASLFQEFNQSKLQQLPENHRALLNQTLATINRLINENILRYKNKEKYLKRVDLLKAHAKANGLDSTYLHNLISKPQEKMPFTYRFKAAIQEVDLPADQFRYYQRQAIKNVADLKDNFGRIQIATGCGKTRIQCALASIGYHVANNNEHIVIVTPNIQLMKQFYQDFVRFNRTTSTCPIPEKAIITVSSNAQSCNIDALSLNYKIKNQKSIMIFCVNSLMNILASNSTFFKNTPLMFTDEYHEYESRIKSIAINHFRYKDRILIGSSATPPESDIFNKTIYSYSRTQGVREKFLAPVIADSLGANYSVENLENLIAALPNIIKKHYHPGFLKAKTLSSTKGIVYLPSIEHCEHVKQKLEQNGIRVFCIHSKNKIHRQQLEAFIKDESPGVVLAFRMLKVGFDLPELAWAIIGQKADKNNYKNLCNIEQMLGRVMRLKEDKIGYILAFNEIVNNIIMPLLKDQPINLPISTDYLAQKTILLSERTLFTIDSPIFTIGEDKGLFFTNRIRQLQPSRSCKRSLLPISQRKLRSNKRTRID